jgi:hypothetical protein
MNTFALLRLSGIGLGVLAASGAAIAQSSIFDDLSGGCPYCSGGGFASDGLPAPVLNAGVAPGSGSLAMPESFLAPLKDPVAETQARAAEKPAAPASATASTVVATASPTSTAAVPSTAPSISAPAGQAVLFPEIIQGADGFWRVDFQNLASFSYSAPPAEKAPTPGRKRNIPSNVLALEGQRVCISGYMLPIQMKGGFVTEFLLLRSPMMCCYGVVPSPNEWVVVKMKARAGKVPPLMDVPLHFYGTLHVGEVYEEKMFSGIYQLDGEKVSVN